MLKITDRQHSGPASTTILWLGLTSVLLVLAVLLESMCLGILYVSDSLRGIDTSTFAKEHLLTKPFASKSPSNHLLGHPPQFFVADQLLGWRLAPATSVFSREHNNESLYITDDHGFIIDLDDPPVAMKKPVDTYRVIVLGGSTVMGQGAPRPSQNIVGMLRKGVRERGLAGDTGKHIEFINAGVDNYNSVQEYLYLVSDLLRFKPDLVIVYDGWNDSHLKYDSSPFRHSHIAWRVAQSYSLPGSAWLLVSNLGHFFAESEFKLAMVELPTKVFRELSPRTNVATFPVDPPFDPRNMQLYRQSRRAFLALADDDMSVALFLQPLVGTDERPLSAEEKASWWRPRLDEALGNRIPFYEHARRILSDLKQKDKHNGHHCIADLSHALTDVSDTIYVDSGHLSPKGNEIVAAHMLDQLVLCGLLQ
jgi:lysophospholipase L1-like esterase